MGWSKKMRFNHLIKAFPFLATLILILFLGFSNKKEYTKLRLLIWNTPSLPLGTYFAISTGSGFILSYLITTNLANFQHLKIKKSIKYKTTDNDEENNELNYVDLFNIKEKTLIERDFNDPSPTINASFRVIGKTERINSNYKNESSDTNIQHGHKNEFDEEYYEQQETNETDFADFTTATDWNDQSYTRW